MAYVLWEFDMELSPEARGWTNQKRDYFPIGDRFLYVQSSLDIPESKIWRFNSSISNILVYVYSHVCIIVLRRLLRNFYSKLLGLLPLMPHLVHAPDLVEGPYDYY
jgi:hypothetical protein